MKGKFYNVIQIIIFWLLLSFYNADAQNQQTLNYQAVVRDATGQALPEGQSVIIRFQIHDGTINGPVVFTETQQTVTNQFGLVNLLVGAKENLGIISGTAGCFD